jgi:hypothetical protein
MQEGGGTGLRDLTGLYHGTLNSGVIAWTTDGLYGGRAIAPSGTSARMNVTLPTLAQVTIETWWKQTSATGYATLLTTGPTRGLWLSGSTLDYYDGGDHLGTTSLTVGRWYQTVVTHDGSTCRFYVNGVPDGTASFTMTATAYTNLLADPSGEHLVGAMGGMRVWNRALTAAEVWQLATYPFRMFAAPADQLAMVGVAAAAGGSARGGFFFGS